MVVQGHLETKVLLVTEGLLEVLGCQEQVVHLVFKVYKVFKVLLDLLDLWALKVHKVCKGQREILDHSVQVAMMETLVLLGHRDFQVSLVRLDFLVTEDLRGLLDFRVIKVLLALQAKEVIKVHRVIQGNLEIQGI